MTQQGVLTLVGNLTGTPTLVGDLLCGVANLLNGNGGGLAGLLDQLLGF